MGGGKTRWGREDRRGGWRDERIEGEMEVGGRQGKEVFSCILSISTEVSKLLQVTRRLCLCLGRGSGLTEDGDLTSLCFLCLLTLSPGTG